MNYSTAVFMLNDDIKAVEVQFFKEYAQGGGQYAGKHYTYKTILKDLKVDDLVVVQVKQEYKIVQVCTLDVAIDHNDDIQYKWVVGKFDDSQYLEILKEENVLIEKLKRLEMTHKREQFRAALGVGDNEFKMLTAKEASDE